MGFRGVIDCVLAMSKGDVWVFVCDVPDDGWCVVVPEVLCLVAGLGKVVVDVGDAVAFCVEDVGKDLSLDLLWGHGVSFGVGRWFGHQEVMSVCWCGVRLKVVVHSLFLCGRVWPDVCAEVVFVLVVRVEVVEDGA